MNWFKRWPCPDRIGIWKCWFLGGGNQEDPEKNLSEQGREPTTKSSHIWFRHRDLNPGHIGEGDCSHPRCPTLAPAEWGDLHFYQADIWQ